MCFHSTNESTSSTQWSPPSWTVPGWQNLVSQTQAASQPWIDNPGSMVYGYNTDLAKTDPQQAIWNAAQARTAPLSDQQIAALQGTDVLAMSNPMFNQATGAIGGTLGGQYAQHAEYNPFGGQSNPYLEDMINNTNTDITRGYDQGTAPDTASSAAMSGAFGGSLHQNVVQNNQRTLAQQLAQNTTGIRANQYNNAAQLEQQRLDTENANYENERNRQMQALGLIPGLQAGQLGVLGAQRDMGQMIQEQYGKYLGSQQDVWNQLLQAPLTGFDIARAGLGSASGVSGTSATSALGPAYSAGQGLLGGGLGIAALMQLFGGGK